MRVISFAWEYPGVGAVLTDLRYAILSIHSALSSRGVEALLVTPEGFGSIPSDASPRKLTLSVKDYPNVVSYGLSIAHEVASALRYITDGYFDKVLCFEWGGCLMGSLARASQPCCMGSSLDCIVLSTEFERGDPLGNILSSSISSIEGWVFNQCRRIFTTSEQAYKSLISRYGLNAELAYSLRDVVEAILK